jgi:methylaspartate mutase epsilon subunit
VDNTVALDGDLGRALLAAFAAGYLDVPFCQHPDNAGRTRGYLDRNGELHWHRIGSLPIGELVELPRADDVNPAGLLGALEYVERTFDQPVESDELALDATYERGSLVADHGGPT